MISGAAIFHNIEKDSLMEIPYMAAKVNMYNRMSQKIPFVEGL